MRARSCLKSRPSSTPRSPAGWCSTHSIEQRSGPSRDDLPSSTVRAINACSGRVIAVGTTVARALEGCAAAHGATLVAGEGTTSLKLGGHHRLAIVDGILTGVHESAASHYTLLEA